MNFDSVGYWSEIKLEIIRKYAQAYSVILSSQTDPLFYHVYIDAFAGGGIHVSRTTGDFVLGSPVNALNVEPSFRDYYFIDLDDQKVKNLEGIAGKRSDVHVYHGDCNEVLLHKVFPQVQFRDRRRGLCLLDPYGLHLDWKVIKAAGDMKSIEIFLNFPVADMNRNVLWRDPTGVDVSQIGRMNRFWGDETWREIAYEEVLTLFGPDKEKASNQVIADAFRERLRCVAGFDYVPEPMPMHNTRGGIVYYLFFASQKAVASKIVKEIFNKYRDRRS